MCYINFVKQPCGRKKSFSGFSTEIGVVFVKLDVVIRGEGSFIHCRLCRLQNINRERTKHMIHPFYYHTIAAYN